MPGSKHGALPLGDIPTKKLLIVLILIKNVVRKERLELSHPKILEPKSSASTNSATPAYKFIFILLTEYFLIQLSLVEEVGWDTRI